MPNSLANPRLGSRASLAMMNGYDLLKSKRVRSFEEMVFSGSFYLSKITFSGDGKRALLHRGLNGMLAQEIPAALDVMDVETAEVFLTLDGRKTHTNINGCLDAEGRYLVVEELRGDARKEEKVTTELASWDIEEKKRLRRFERRETPARALRLMSTPDGKRVLTVDSDETARLRDVATGKKVWSIKLREQSVPAFVDQAKRRGLPIPLTSQVNIPTFLSDGKRLAFVFARVAPHGNIWTFHSGDL
jgi:WD40 repeat protein